MSKKKKTESISKNLKRTKNRKEKTNKILRPHQVKPIKSKVKH